MQVLESTIQRSVVSWARAHGIIAIKLSTLGMRGVAGWPDFMFLFEKKIVFMEFKRPGGRLTPLQLSRHKKLEEQGFRPYTVDVAVAGINILGNTFFPA